MSHFIPNLYTHEQTTASTTWTIVHNLGGNGSGVPIIDVFINNNSKLEKVIARVTVDTPNQATVSFTDPQTGRAIVIV